MIVDASAVIAVLAREAGSERIVDAMVATRSRMSVANWLEAAIVADHRPSLAPDDLDVAIESLGITLEPVTAEQARVLGVESGTPLLLIVRTSFADNGVAVEFSRDYHRSDRTAIRIRSRAEPTPSLAPLVDP